jgi:hypothetical protein
MLDVFGHVTAEEAEAPYRHTGTPPASPSGPFLTPGGTFAQFIQD